MENDRGDRLPNSGFDSGIDVAIDVGIDPAVVADGRMPRRARPLAVVVDASESRRRECVEVLEHAGYTVVSVGDRLSFGAAVGDRPIAVVVLDDSVPESAVPHGYPIIHLVDLARTSDVSGYSALDGADWVAKPVNPSELVHRADALVARLALGKGNRQQAEHLRSAIRDISTAIRSTNETRTMIDALVTGLGQAFEVDRVWLTTFDEEDLPRTTASWPRRDAQGFHGDAGVDDTDARRLTERIWNENRPVLVDNVRLFEPLTGEAWIAEWAVGLGVSAFAIVPVGHGDSVVGMIILANVREPRSWSSLEVSLMTHLSQNLAYGLMQGRLISAQQFVLTKMKELERSKNEMMATVNHDLRSPLTSITGYLELLQDGDGGPIPEAAGEMLRIVAHNTTRLTNLVNDLLTLTKLDSRATDFNAVPVGLDQLLGRVVDAIRPFAVTQKVALTLERGDVDATVDGDEVQLERAFTNITDNAVKYTPAGGSVRVTIERGVSASGDPAVVVNVVDTGMGIPAEDLPRLFGRFFRASNATAAGVPGTGLGLAIVQSLIRAHGGDISVESDVATGTAIRVELPAGRGSGHTTGE